MEGLSKTVAIIQARYRSSRLQGKVMLDLGNISVLGNVIRRLQKCNRLDGIVVATRNEPENNIIIQEAIKHGAQYFVHQGDVLTRFYKCAKFFGIDRIVRITADCPFIMPDLVDELIVGFEGFKYGSNVLKRTYPKGFDCEIFDFHQLERAFNLATEREHVTPWIIQNVKEKYSLEDKDDYSHKRITLDTPNDYKDLLEYNKIIGNVYDYQEFKNRVGSLTSTEEYCINLELGRV